MVEGPIPAEGVVEGCIYRRLIDTVEGDEVAEVRTPLYDGRAPFIYIKRRPGAHRFDQISSIELRETSEVFFDAEPAALRRFGVEMRLDWGELDVLRDAADGRIYVVDVSNTPRPCLTPTGYANCWARSPRTWTGAP